MKKLAVVFALVFGASVFAGDGSSGCGPGWYVFKKNSLVSSSLRATTNGILFPAVTLGMTFGTSNCTKHSIVKTEDKSLYFVTQNYIELKTEVAKGNGEFLQAFGQTIGCKNQDLPYFSKKLQDKYQDVFKDKASNEEVLMETYKVILTDPTLVQSCSLS